MRKIKKKCCAILLSFILAISMIWQGIPVLAEEGSADSTKKVVNSYRDIDEAPPVSVKDYENSHIPQDVGDGLEEKYDHVHQGDSSEINTSLPAIKNQGSIGTCWAHSVMAMIEMNLFKKHSIVYEDMSEFQSVFFMNHDWIDPLGLCSGDNFRTVDDDTNVLSSDWYDHGGNTAYTKFMLMDWVGAVSENEYKDTAYDILLEKEGDAYLDDSYAISKDNVHVQNVNVINSKDTNVIKEMIKEYGAVGISYFEDDNYYNSDDYAYYNPNNNNDNEKKTNHAVVLVGWDDNFKKENFNTYPSGNGAWLVRNSWGSDSRNYGYFWISYEDASLADVAYSLDVAYRSGSNRDENYYDYNYQYDGGVSTTTMHYNNTDTGVDEANIFVANGEEELKAVAIYAGANYNYDIKIYTNLTDKSDPVSGTLSASKSGTQIYEGYHTVKLDKGVLLNEGEIFSVVVTLKNNNNDYTNLALDNTLTGTWMYSESEAKSGQSFYRPSISGYSWTDAGDDGANLRIKAYTNNYNYTETPITSINIECESPHIMNVRETYNLAEKIFVEPENHTDKIIYSSNNKDIASVDNAGLITALKPGDVVITAKSYVKSITASIAVHVLSSGKPAESITLSKEQMTLLEGDAEKIDAILTPIDSEDEITWSSDNPEIATVDTEGNVTGVVKGKAIITATITNGESASCAVKVKKRRGETIICTYDKIPKKIYKFNTYKISTSNAMKKLSPTKIDWTLIIGNKDNIVLTPVGENGKDGCDLYVKQVNSDFTKRRGEKLRLQAIATYIKTNKKGEVTKTRTYKRNITSYNLSYELVLDTKDISIIKKGETIPLNVIFNDGDADDQPTNSKIKWMITDAAGKKDRKGGKVISVNSKGIIKSKTPGVTYVTAFAVDSYIRTSKSYTVSDTIKVTCVPVTSVAFSETSLSLAKLGTSNLKEKLIFNNGTEEPFNKAGMKLTWSSSNKQIVSVDKNGVAKVTNKANSGETCKITVKATGGVPKGQTVPEATIDIIVQ